VRAAFRAEARRSAGVRRRAADRAWRDNDLRDAAERPSRFNARFTARDRRVDAARCLRERRLADAALRLVLGLALAGGFPSFTPARRAFDKPIAIACFVDRAPCLPSRM
jgi:hypothetical protein